MKLKYQPLNKDIFRTDCWESVKGINYVAFKGDFWVLPWIKVRHKFLKK